MGKISPSSLQEFTIQERPPHKDLPKSQREKVANWRYQSSTVWEKNEELILKNKGSFSHRSRSI